MKPWRYTNARFCIVEEETELKSICSGRDASPLGLTGNLAELSNTTCGMEGQQNEAYT